MTPDVSAAETGAVRNARIGTVAVGRDIGVVERRVVWGPPREAGAQRAIGRVSRDGCASAPCGTQVIGGLNWGSASRLVGARSRVPTGEPWNHASGAIRNSSVRSQPACTWAWWHACSPCSDWPDERSPGCCSAESGAPLRATVVPEVGASSPCARCAAAWRSAPSIRSSSSCVASSSCTSASSDSAE